MSAHICPECGKTLSTAKGLYGHLRLAHGSAPDALKRLKSPEQAQVQAREAQIDALQRENRALREALKRAGDEFAAAFGQMATGTVAALSATKGAIDFAVKMMDLSCRLAKIAKEWKERAEAAEEKLNRCPFARLHG